MSLRELVEQHYSGVESGDPDRAVAVFHEDVEVSTPGMASMRGREAHRAVAQGYVEAFPDAKFTIKNVIESGDWIVVEGTYSGTHSGPMRGPQGELPASGRRVSIDYADVFRLVCGLYRLAPAGP
jgi:predicted ester cyclase